MWNAIDIVTFFIRLFVVFDIAAQLGSTSLFHAISVPNDVWLHFFGAPLNESDQQRFCLFFLRHSVHLFNVVPVRLLSTARVCQHFEWGSLLSFLDSHIRLVDPFPTNTHDGYIYIYSRYRGLIPNMKERKIATLSRHFQLQLFSQFFFLSRKTVERFLLVQCSCFIFCVLLCLPKRMSGVVYKMKFILTISRSQILTAKLPTWFMCFSRFFVFRTHDACVSREHYCLILMCVFCAPSLEISTPSWSFANVRT